MMAEYFLTVDRKLKFEKQTIAEDISAKD